MLCIEDNAWRAYGEYALYHFVKNENEFRRHVLDM